MPGPIATPTLASIDAALNPDTKDHYLYFLAKRTARAGRRSRRRHAEHEAEHREVRATSGRDRRCRARRISRRRPRRRITPAGPRRTARPGRPGSSGCGPGSRALERRRLLRRRDASTCRYLTGFALADGEEKVAGHSGQFLVGARRGRRAGRSRGTRSRPRREAPESRIVDAGYDLPGALVRSSSRRVGAQRVAVEAGFVPYAVVAAARGRGAGRRARPGRGLGRGRPGDEGAGRARAGRGGLRGRGPGARDAAAARSGRASTESGPRARARVADADRRRRGDRLRRRRASSARRPRCPTGRRPTRPVETVASLLFDFGAQVDGYRSDMTRTLFVGEPTERDLAVYELVARGPDRGHRPGHGARSTREVELPSGRDARRRRPRRDRRRRPLAGVSATGSGHGIGLATHERPSLSRSRARRAAAVADGLLASSPGSTSRARRASGSRTSSCLDAGAGRLELLTRFPRDVLVVG